jgi:hypothetical protein
MRTTRVALRRSGLGNWVGVGDETYPTPTRPQCPVSSCFSASPLFLLAEANGTVQEPERRRSRRVRKRSWLGAWSGSAILLAFWNPIRRRVPERSDIRLLIAETWHPNRRSRCKSVCDGAVEPHRSTRSRFTFVVGRRQLPPTER